MIWLKNILLVILCVILGIALGGGIFLVQNRYLPSSTQATSEVKTATPTPTLKTVLTFKNDLVSFPLPKKTVVSEEVLDSKTSQLELFTTTSDTVIQITGVNLFTLNKTGLSTATLATQKAALKKKALTGLIADPLKTITPTLAGPNYYLSTTGSSVALYENDSDKAYVFTTQDLGVTATLSSTDLAAIIASLTTTDTTTTSASISTSPLLNQSL